MNAERPSSEVLIVFSPARGASAIEAGGNGTLRAADIRLIPLALRYDEALLGASASSSRPRAVPAHSPAFGAFLRDSVRVFAPIRKFAIGVQQDAAPALRPETSGTEAC